MLQVFSGAGTRMGAAPHVLKGAAARSPSIRLSRATAYPLILLAGLGMWLLLLRLVGLAVGS